jgi:osmotically-inducible protein OsmY
MYIKNIYKALTLTLVISTLLLSGCAAVVVGTAATSAVVAQDRRTTGTFIEDKSIQIKSIQAVQRIANDDPKIHVSVICYNNRVLLVGQAPSRRVRSDIDAEVRRIEKVKQVHNEIQIKEPTNLKERSIDSWITTRIKSEMAVTKDINPTRVKVITEDGIVYLMGIIKPHEEDIAVEIARHTKGVNKVVKIFEYDTGVA